MGSELISSQLAIAYASSSLIEWFKKRPGFPLLSADTPSLNRWAGLLTSFVTALGIHWITDWQATNGVLTVTITGLTVGNVAHGLLAWIQQYAMQQGAYRLLVKSA